MAAYQSMNYLNDQDNLDYMTAGDRALKPASQRVLGDISSSVLNRQPNNSKMLNVGMNQPKGLAHEKLALISSKAGASNKVPSQLYAQSNKAASNDLTDMVAMMDEEKADNSLEERKEGEKVTDIRTIYSYQAPATVATVEAKFAINGPKSTMLGNESSKEQKMLQGQIDVTMNTTDPQELQEQSIDEGRLHDSAKKLQEAVANTTLVTSATDLIPETRNFVILQEPGANVDRNQIGNKSGNSQADLTNSFQRAISQNQSQNVTNQSSVTTAEQSKLRGMTVKDIWTSNGQMQLLEQLGLTEVMLDSDIKHASDVQYVADVALDCTQHMLRTEAEHVPSCDCVSNEKQPQLKDRMRQILVSWLIEVHLKFRLLPETLYVTVNLVDRYCEKVEVPRSEYQLLGVTAMLIACKYEEIFVPKIEDFVDITDNTYSHQ